MELPEEHTMTAASATSLQRDFIQEGAWVLLDINDGDKHMFAHVRANERVKIGKAMCKLEPLIGAPFGSVFEVQWQNNENKLQLLNPQDNDGLICEKGTDEGVDTDKDNRGLVDDNQAQSLSKEDIERMKKEGRSGKEIVDALVANSSSFQTKTEFSQAKYLKKKQKKYAPRVMVRCPTARSVCEALFLKSNAKIGGLRVDTLSLLLSLANVGAYAEVLVIDYCGGLPTAAVAERLGGFGRVCSAFIDPKGHTVDLACLFNLSDQTFESIKRSPLSALVKARKAAVEEERLRVSSSGLADACQGGLVTATHKNGTSTSEEADRLAVQMTTGSSLSDLEGKGYSGDVVGMEGVEVVEGGAREGGEGGVEDMAVVGAEGERRGEGEAVGGGGGDGGGGVGGGGKDEDAAAAAGVRKAKRKGLQLARAEEIEEWASKGFSSLVIAAPGIHPRALVPHVLPLLRPSAPFAIFFPYSQPLAESLDWMRSNQAAVAMQLSEPWLREYQVLPSRTHPEMQMSASGGYVLSGIRIELQEQLGAGGDKVVNPEPRKGFQKRTRR